MDEKAIIPNQAKNIEKCNNSIIKRGLDFIERAHNFEYIGNKIDGNRYYRSIVSRYCDLIESFVLLFAGDASPKVVNNKIEVG